MSATESAIREALPSAETVLSQLRALSYEELSRRAALETSVITGLPSRVSLTTYIDVLTAHGDDIQVAVQLVAHGRFGFSRVWARGFRVSPTNTQRDLSEEELWEYS